MTELQQSIDFMAVAFVVALSVTAILLVVDAIGDHKRRK